MRIRTAIEQDATVIAEAEWVTAQTPGMLVGRPGEIPIQAFASKIARLRRKVPIGLQKKTAGSLATPSWNRCA